MPTLRKTEYTGRIEWLGRSDATTETLRSVPLDQMELGFHGLDAARHSGETRPSCVRVRALYDRGTEIRNVRQLSILSAEEMAAIATEIGVEALDPALLGVNIVVSGLPDFTHTPPSARLQSASGTTLTVDMENQPCILPAREIETETPGHGEAFPKAAMGRRGVTAWVERPGPLSIGDELSLFVPTQRAWAP